MDRDEAIRRAEMFVDWVAGRNEYQFAASIEPDKWHNVPAWDDDMAIDFAERFMDGYYIFRLKPKPLECWVWIPNYAATALPEVHVTGVFNFGERMPPLAPAMSSPGRWVRMREVTDETDD